MTFKKLLFFISVFSLASCAFIGHKDVREYKSETAQAPSKNLSIEIMVNGADDKIVGHIKNNFGTETADIETAMTKNNLVKSALEQEFTKSGYQISPSSPNKLLARIKQVEIELANNTGAAGYYAVCDLQVYLKTDKLYERNFVENEKIESFWYVTAEEGVSTLFKAVNKCSSSIVKETEKKVKP